MRPPVTVRLRQGWRTYFLQQPRMVQAVAAAAAVLLLVNLVAVAAGPSSSTKVSTQGAKAGVGPGALGGTTGGANGAGTTGGTNGTTGGVGGTSGATGGFGTGGSGGSSTGIGTTGGTTGGTTSGTTAPLTASDRGVTPTSIRVVFPWPDLGPLNQTGFATGNSEDPTTSIKTFVEDINNKGGINGRKIDPEIVSYNPLDDADMTSKAIKWTQDEKVFAVVDIEGAWHDQHQLEITQDGHTPLISEWSTVSDWTKRGEPYLWWVSPNADDVLSNLVAWAKQDASKPLAKPVGILYGDRYGDKAALNNYLIPDLQKAGVKVADTAVINFSTQDQALAQGQARIAVQRFKSEGIQTIFPLISFLQLVDFAQAEKEQTYFPRLMLSDYEQGLNVALGMLDLGYQKSVDGLTGPTFFVLGNSDDPRGYDAQAMDCWQVFRKRNLGTYKNTDGSTWNGYIESTGVASKACETIRLFAAAARNAGPVLTRVGWANAMKAMTDFQGTTVPYQSFSQTRRSGAHRMRIVQVHENTDKRCPKKVDGGDQGTCWLIIQDFQEHLQL